LKTRGGKPASWDIEWKNGRFRLPAQEMAEAPVLSGISRRA
jgi:hypothetical protein